MDEDFGFLNTQYEDVGAIIGVEAAMRLMALCGGDKILIPQAFSPDSKNTKLGRILGEGALRRIIEELPGERISVPEGELIYLRYQRVRTVSIMLGYGLSVEEVAHALNLKVRQVANLRAQAEKFRLMEPILTGKRTDPKSQMALI
jgi:hypothetical protein